MEPFAPLMDFAAWLNQPVKKKKENKMNRKEMEEILKAIMTLMKLLLPYVNKPDQEIWSDMIGEVGATIFATDEEY